MTVHPRPLLLAALLAAPALLAPAGAVGVQANAAYLLSDVNYPVYTGAFSWHGACNGPATVTLAYKSYYGDRVATVDVVSSMVPDLCSIACLGCPVPFTWTLAGKDVQLGGGGVAGAGYTLAGPFLDGVLVVAQPAARGN